MLDYVYIVDSRASIVGITTEVWVSNPHISLLRTLWELQRRQGLEPRTVNTNPKRFKGSVFRVYRVSYPITRNSAPGGEGAGGCLGCRDGEEGLGLRHSLSFLVIG